MKIDNGVIEFDPVKEIKELEEFGDMIRKPLKLSWLGQYNPLATVVISSALVAIIFSLTGWLDPNLSVPLGTLIGVAITKLVEEPMLRYCLCKKYIPATLRLRREIKAITLVSHRKQWVADLTISPEDLHFSVCPLSKRQWENIILVLRVMYPTIKVVWRKAPW